MSAPANTSLPHPHLSSPIAGSVLPIKRAEELLATLPGVIAARIIASESGAVDEIHLLTTAEVTPKQTVRNVESALIAHLGMRVDHRKISVATTVEATKAKEASGGGSGGDGPRQSGEIPALRIEPIAPGRRYYFEDVEVRRSRAKGVACRVTLRRGEEIFVGESEGVESERSRADLAARATIQAILLAEHGERSLALDGVKLIEAFDREFVFAGVTARWGRETVLLTGSCEIRDSAETASALAILDATNRWIAHTK